MKRRRKSPLLEAYLAQHRRIMGADEPRRGTLASGALPGDAPMPPPRSPTGPFPLANEDHCLVDEMRSLIKSGAARTPNAAANMVADKAKGAGTRQSKAKRLTRRYRKRFGRLH